MIEFKNQSCPLCKSVSLTAYHRDTSRDYLKCAICDLVCVPAAQHLLATDEKAHYELHDNRPDDPRYRQFLDRLFSPLQQRLTPNSRGLDFGCGPGPTLSVMFEEAGHSVALYDPYYAPDKSVLSAPYDFITLSEVAEHMAEPGKKLDHLWDILVPNGWLAIMTKRVRDPEAFKAWHYITDPTHVAFFSEASFQWLTEKWSSRGPKARLIIAGDDVVLIEKGSVVL